jgi:phage shock protein C
MYKKLYRSRKERVIAGVCGGLAKYFEMDPVIVRIIAVVLLFCGGAGFWIYLLMGLIVPLEPETTTAQAPAKIIDATNK